MTGVQDGINGGTGFCVVEWLCTGFDGDAYGITFGIENFKYLGGWDIYFEGFHYGNLEGLVTGGIYAINIGAGWCVVGGLGTSFDGDADGI